MWKGTVVHELLDRTISATCCAEVVSPPTVSSRTVMEKQNFRRFEMDANDDALYECECQYCPK